MRTFLALCFVCLAGWACAAPIKVACIGDSITYGYTIPNREKNCYPTQLQALLGDGYEVRNFGNSGRGIYLHSWRGKERRGYRYMKEHQAALAWQPDIVICNLGINDNGEYLKYERENPGAWKRDYLTLLADYQALPTKPKLYIWGKLAPLAEGQTFYRSSEPFLMQADLRAIAEEAGAIAIDMQAPLLPILDTEFPDKIHPTAAGAKVIAEVAYQVLTAGEPEIPPVSEKRPANKVGWGVPMPAPDPVELPADIADTAEVWLCAGQSNMHWPLGWCAKANEEAAATAKHDIRLWDYHTGQWRKITPQNAKEWSAIAISFAIRRAEATKKPVALLLVAVGGAPTEAFLSETTMAAVDAAGKPLYPTLQKIITTRKPMDTNDAVPYSWCKKVYRQRLNAEAGGWGMAMLYDLGISRVEHLPLTGILWYQGESNASTAVSAKDDTPLPEAYMEETLRAIVHELRPTPETPFLMVGLPVMNRPWEPYRALQKKVCEATGATYLDTFSAGLGDKNNVHPVNKIPFAEMASEAATQALK